MIGSLILILSVSYAAVVCHKSISDQFKDARITLVVSAGMWLASEIYSSFSFAFSEAVADISLIVTYSVILVAFLMLIRELKPAVFRYPYFAVFMPLIMPVSYYLIYQTSMMREIIVHSISGMIVMISLLLSISYRTDSKSLISAISGSLLLTASILVSFILDDDKYIHLIWYVVSGTGLSVAAYGFVNTFNNNVDID